MMSITIHNCYIIVMLFPHFHMKQLIQVELTMMFIAITHDFGSNSNDTISYFEICEIVVTDYCCVTRWWNVIQIILMNVN